MRKTCDGRSAAARRLVMQVVVEVVAHGLHPRMQRRERADVVDGEVEPVAGEHAVLEHIAAVYGLQVVEDCLVEEIIARHARVLPVDGRLPAEAAAEYREQADEIADAERERAHGEPERPGEARGKREPRPAPREHEQREQPPEHIGEHERAREPHGQVELLHEREEERPDIVVRRVEHQLAEIRMELPVVGKARDVEHRDHDELRARCCLPADVFYPRQEIVRERARHEGDERERARRLAREARAAHDGREHIRRACTRPHVFLHPAEEKQPKKEKDCKVEEPYLQSFSQQIIECLPGENRRPPHGRMISTP